MKSLLTTAAAFALLSAVATASEPARLTRVEAKPLGTGLDVVIQGEHLPQPRSMRILSNTSFILEFDAWLEGAPTRLPQTTGPAKFVEWGWYTNRPARVRVHVKLSNGATPVRFTKEEDGYHILVDLPTDSDELAKLRAAAAPTAPAGMEGLIKPEETPIVGGDDRQPFRNLISDLRNPVITDPVIIPSSTPPTSTPPVEEKKEETAPPVSNPPVEEKKEEVTPPVTTPPVEEKKEEATPPVSTPPVEVKEETVPPVRATPVRTPRPTPTNTTSTTLTAAINPQDIALTRKVSLDFVDTDVVQILKALAMQANVNIITSPEVSPSDKPLLLTLSLTNVTLEDSLSFITAMSGLRFARVASTFVVTPADKLSDTMRQILERNNNYQTRVVNLVSGEAKQIRDATLKANPQDGREGYYEIIVPENASATNMTAIPQNLVPPVEGQAGQAGQAVPPANPAQPQAAPASGRIYYLMIVGDVDRLNSIETYVRGLDQNISNSFSLSRTEDIGTVAIPVQSGDPSKIQTMIQRLIAESPRAADYSIQQTAISELVGSDAPSQVLLMVGPKTELGRLKTFAMALDQQLCEAVGIAYTADTNGLGREYAILELRYLEPMVAEFDLKNRIRGLHVTIVPDPVTPGITGEDEGEKADDPATAQNQGGGAGSGGGSTNRTSDLTRQVGHEPMRLIVRGTPDQIAQARNYLALVDVAPRQVALELRVLELSKEDALKLGLDWGLLTGGRLISSRINMNPGVAADTPGAISGAYQGVGSFLGALDQLNDRNHLIARPNALVSDGRTTRLFVGDTIRYIKQIQASQSGTTVITDELEVGALFDIKARIGSEGNIALDLEQNFSILTSFLPVPGGGSLPQTSDRRTNMFVNMKSGETIAIGGLILEQDRSSVSGIPILKDLPIIGRLLFSRTTTSRDRTEIVFFLTAKVVDESNRGDAASPRVNEEAVPDPLRIYRETGGNTGGSNP